MVRYIVVRLFIAVFVLFLVSAGSFYLIHLLPGDPAVVVLGTGATPAGIKAFNHQWGLDLPFYEQYFHWIVRILHGNFGTSFITQTSIRTTIAGSLPIDGEILIISQIMALGMAIPTAMRAARKPGGIFDNIASGTAFVFLSIPGFVLIAALVDLLSFKWNIPYTGPYAYNVGGDWVTNFYCLLEPSFVIALGSFVIYFRVLRSDLISSFQEDFITMARSKGLSRRRIMWRHAFRPSSLTLFASIGLIVSGAVAGYFVVEALTGVPGLGFQFFTALGTSDYVLLQAVALIISVAVVVAVLVIDLLFGFIDPRISLE